jgi:hypothetical protein
MAGEDEQGSDSAQERPSTRVGLQVRGWAEQRAAGSSWPGGAVRWAVRGGE